MQKNLAHDIQWTVSLSYGQDYEDVANKVPVLIMESTFKNISIDHTYLLSFWKNRDRLASIGPRSSYKTTASNYQAMGMPSPPKADSAVELKPGESTRRREWYWAQEILPWVSADQKLVYTEDSLAYSGLPHFKKKHFDSGSLQSPEVSLDFKIYSPE